MSEIGTIEVIIKTKRGKKLGVLTLANGQLKIDGTLHIAAEALDQLAKHQIALSSSPIESEATE